MPKDHSERRTYRKSPGRQYGYEYDPLRSRSGQSQSGASRESERWSGQGKNTSRSSAELAQRPDPRRTRQLLRQNILASKARPLDEAEDFVEDDEPYVEQIDERTITRRQPPRSEYRAQPRLPSTSELAPGEEEDEWADFADTEQNYEYTDLPESEATYNAMPAEVAPQPVARRATIVPPRSQRPRTTQEDEYEEYDEEETIARKRGRPRKKKVSRRGLLIGLGAAAVAGTGITAYELGPKLPQAIGEVGTNIEHQLQDAFNKGLAQGAENARKEFLTALDSLEGYTLQGAIAGARLTRQAYDVFVSPIITFGSTIAGDLLGGMLQALKTARYWLGQVHQDNQTLESVQKVLENWVSQVHLLPKQLDAITQTDLDGAQSYLLALQRKVEDEKAKLNGTTPPPTTQPTPKATPKS